MQKKELTEDEIKKLADKLNLDLNKYPLSELYAGYNVELEHGTKGNWNITNDDPEMTLKIALAHLDEGISYYQKLEVLENELKQEKQKNEVKSFIKNIIKEIIKNK